LNASPRKIAMKITNAIGMKQKMINIVLNVSLILIVGANLV